jgi:hypothetical protein
MAKKSSLLVAAMAVLAFAVPAMASAAAPLSETGGTVVVPVGSGITLTSTNMRTKTSLGTFGCKKVELMGKVTLNEESAKGPKAEGSSSEEFTGSECELEGVSVPVKNIKLTNLKTGSGLGLTTGTGTASFSYTALFPPSVDCVYTATNQPFTYSTTAMTNSIKFTNVSLIGSPAACGNATFSADFALTTTGTTTPIAIT